MQIKIVGVGEPETKQGPKAKYSMYKLEYAVDGKLRERKIMSFNKEVYGTLKAASPGECFEIITKKNGEFWDWVEVNKAQPNEGNSSPQAAVSQGNNSRYESSEERAQRQIMIVRQSCIGYAVNFLKDAKNPAPKADEVLELADYFVKYVTNFSIETPEFVDDADQVV